MIAAVILALSASLVMDGLLAVIGTARLSDKRGGAEMTLFIALAGPEPWFTIAAQSLERSLTSAL
jgi:hypothetical protein